MAVPKGERLNVFFVASLRVVPVAALVIGYVGLVSQVVGLDTALHILLIIAVGMVGVVAFLSKWDTDDRFELLAVELGELRDEVSDGFDSLGAAIDGEARRPDGGTTPSLQTMVYEHTTFDLELQPPTGIGAVTGVLVGSVLGAPFGLLAVAVGGIIGGLIGQVFEYRKQKERHRTKLRRAASQYLRRHVSPRPRLRSFEGVTADADEDGAFRVYEFVDEAGESLRVKLYPDEERFALVEDG